MRKAYPADAVRDSRELEDEGPEPASNTALIKETMFSGNLWGLEWGMPGGIHGSETSEATVTEMVTASPCGSGWRIFDAAWRMLG